MIRFLSLEFPFFHRVSKKERDFSGMGRGLLFGFSLLVVGSGLVLWLALWAGLSAVEWEVIKQAKHLDFPVIVDSLSRPLDTIIESRLKDVLYLSERRIVTEWIEYNLTDQPEKAAKIQPLIETTIAHHDFSCGFISLVGQGGIWFYADGHLSKANEQVAISPGSDWFRHYSLDGRPHQIEFVPKGTGGTLWFIVPVGIESAEGQNLIGLCASTERIIGEIQKAEQKRNRFLFPDGYSLLKNEDINLWVVDSNGMIILSDKDDQVNQSIYSFLPEDIRDNFLTHITKSDRPAHSHTVQSEKNGTIELVHYPLLSGSMEVVITIPHAYVVGFIQRIRNYVLLCGALALVALVGAMFMIYRYVIDPARRVRRINRELATVVKERTESLEKVVNFDSLTGVYNRRYFDYSLRLTYARCLVEKQPLTILFLDVDFFKKYNDSCGHVAGDQCLQKVAGILKHGCHRSHDLVARYGGEEFVVLLPETEADGGLIIAERLRASVEQAGIPHLSSDVAAVITVSIGLFSLVPSEETSPRQMLEQADDALYRAKKGGRNRVYKAESELT